MGDALERGVLVDRDMSAAMALYRQGAGVGDSKCMNRLGELLEGGLNPGVAVDVKEAVSLYERAARLGDADSHFHLGVHLEAGSGGYEKDAHRAFNNFVVAARHGHVRALVALARCFEIGVGVAVNLREAARCWHEASGVMSVRKAMEEDRGGVDEELKVAFHFYNREAANGDDICLFILGHCYELGRGVEADVKQAFDCYRRSAEKGNADGLTISRELLRVSAIGVEVDLKQAFDYYRRSAEKGNAVRSHQSRPLLRVRQ